MIKKGTPVYIKWEDIQGHGDWNEDPECPDTASMGLYGIIAEDVDKRFRKVGICTNHDNLEDTVHDRTDFPSGCIISIRKTILGEELWDLSKPDEEPDA